MADEKDPDLDPSKHDDDEATSPDQHVDNSATPDSETHHEPDPETRMLEQIAALENGDPETGDQAEARDQVDANDQIDANDQAREDEQPTQVVDDVSDDAAPEAAGQTGPATEAVPTHEPIEATTDDTAFLSPIPAGGSGSGADDGSSRPTAREKKRRWPWIVAVVVLLLGGAYVGAAFATQDSLPATLTVEGVDVSGLSVEEAAPVLEEEFAARAERELTVTVEDTEATIVPADSGYSYDVDATLADLTELTFDPVTLWSRLFGEAHVAAETSIDETTSSETIAGLAEQLTFDPTEGSIVFEGASLDYSEPINGFTLDQEALAEQLADEWLTDTTQLEAPGDVEDPAISPEEWEQFIADTAQPLIDDAYTVTADDTTAQLSPAQLAVAAEVRVEATADAEETAAEETAENTAAETATATEEAGVDRPVLLLDGEALTTALAENNSEFESTNQDATVQLSGAAGSGTPEVVPGSSGRGVDGEQVVDEILADLAGEQTRAVAVELHEVEPDVTTEDAEAWDVTHVVAEYATPYPPQDTPRTANLRVGADRVNGTVVMPGDEFNLNSLLSPVTEANGYYSSGVVESGVVSDAVGGGLSQIATMSYNAGFLGGMEIVEHKPHSRWFDRYPQGRESTYWEGQINVRWKNDTDAPVIVEMWLANNEVHTRLWGSDYYDISTSTSDPYNQTAAPTIRSSASDCVPERGGRQGFTVDVNRTKTPPSGGPIQESWSWAYSGWPTVICE